LSEGFGDPGTKGLLRCLPRPRIRVIATRLIHKNCLAYISVDAVTVGVVIAIIRIVITFSSSQRITDGNRPILAGGDCLFAYAHSTSLIAQIFRFIHVTIAVVIFAITKFGESLVVSHAKGPETIGATGHGSIGAKVRFPLVHVTGFPQLGPGFVGETITIVVQRIAEFGLFTFKGVTKSGLPIHTSGDLVRTHPFPTGSKLNQWGFTFFVYVSIAVVIQTVAAGRSNLGRRTIRPVSIGT